MDNLHKAIDKVYALARQLRKDKYYKTLEGELDEFFTDKPRRKIKKKSVPQKEVVWRDREIRRHEEYEFDRRETLPDGRDLHICLTDKL